ncbi:glycoside hydrolase family 3 protein [Euzebya sp.]|uniref:glycoside hydrolase family 3 protein n=1 Tax=Euzebya sp. TaxID=1971409 RepID=UPI003518B386
MTRIGDHLLLGFEGHELPPDTADLLARGIGIGVTLFRHGNVRDVAQVRELTDAIRRAAGRPVLVCADQEGGQFLALGDDTTPFAGNLALGAADDPDLTRRVAAAMAAEIRAAGVDVDYAPVCDLLTNPDNPNLGIRCFGADPDHVARHAAAFTAGLVDGGAVAAAKHFPGKGDAAVDSHHQLPTLPHDLAAMEGRELVPFAAALDAGAQLVMTAHAAYPAITGRSDLPATLARPILTDLLRGRLGFDGVVVTDALDMKALGQGARQAIDAISALRAGADLLLATAQPGMTERLVEGLDAAVSRDLLEIDDLARSAARTARLAAAVDGPRPPLDVIGSAAHRDLAAELAARATTLVRDPAGLLPLSPSARVLAVMPRPFDRTPADTSSTVAPQLAAALGAVVGSVDELVVDGDPDGGKVDEAVRRAASADVVVLGTIDAHAHPGQAALAGALAGTGRPLVTTSLRVPADLAVLPDSTTHLATYGILRPSLDALAAVLVGAAPARGRLPIDVVRYPRGHGLGAS